MHRIKIALILFLVSACNTTANNSSAVDDGKEQFLVGWNYYSGIGVIQDYKTAAKWYLIAAEKGHAKAQNNIGLMYLEGSGVSKDDKIGAFYIHLAAEQGLASAQTTLSALYLRGQGVIQDDVAAYMWSNIAASSGNTVAVKNRETAKQRLTRFHLGSAQRLSRECIEKNYINCYRHIADFPH